MKMAYLLMAFSLFITSISPLALAAEHEIEMLNNSDEYGMMVFSPPILKVEVGDTVTFIPTDSAHKTEIEIGPEGGVEWKGEANKKVTVTIDKEGVYLYSCEPHKMMAMVGLIQAGKAANIDEVTEKSKELTAGFALNKERLTNYLEELKALNSVDTKKADTKTEREDKETAGSEEKTDTKTENEKTASSDEKETQDEDEKEKTDSDKKSDDKAS